MADIFEISGRIHSTSQEEVVTTSSEILDEEQNKKQSEVNADVDTALADRYTKEETYSKSQLDNLITTPDVQYVTVATYSALPATGEADTIYRVASWDGTAVDAGKYSEYAWNGSAYQLLAVRSGSLDGVFDISEYNKSGSPLAPTQYADLEAALGSSGANVPENVRKGGMSVKFINSTSGKYEQCRLMAASWSTTVADWQGVDSTPTANSDNLVTSGGVKSELDSTVLSNRLYNNKYLVPISKSLFTTGYYYSIPATKKVGDEFNINPTARGNSAYLNIEVQKGDLLYVDCSVTGIWYVCLDGDSIIRQISTSYTGSVSEPIIVNQNGRFILSIYNVTTTPHSNFKVFKLTESTSESGIKSVFLDGKKINTAGDDNSSLDIPFGRENLNVYFEGVSGSEKEILSTDLETYGFWGSYSGNTDNFVYYAAPQGTTEQFRSIIVECIGYDHLVTSTTDSTVYNCIEFFDGNMNGIRMSSSNSDAALLDETYQMFDIPKDSKYVLLTAKVTTEDMSSFYYKLVKESQIPLKDLGCYRLYKKNIRNGLLDIFTTNNTTSTANIPVNVNDRIIVRTSWRPSIILSDEGGNVIRSYQYSDTTGKITQDGDYYVMDILICNPAIKTAVITITTSNKRGNTPAFLCNTELSIIKEDDTYEESPAAIYDFYKFGNFGYYASKFANVSPGDTVSYIYGQTEDRACVRFYDVDKNYVGTIPIYNVTGIEGKVPEGVSYVQFLNYTNNTDPRPGKVIRNHSTIEMHTQSVVENDGIYSEVLFKHQDKTKIFTIDNVDYYLQSPNNISCLVTPTERYIVCGSAGLMNLSNVRKGTSVVLRYSDDKGVTWSDIKIAFENLSWNAGESAQTLLPVSAPTLTINNSGRLFIMFSTRNNSAVDADLGALSNASERRMLYIYSDDYGDTWSEPVDITEVIISKFNEVITSLYPTCGAGCSKNGTLIFPTYAYKTTAVSTGSRGFIIYSVDDGDTWNCTDIISTDGVAAYASETAVCELQDNLFMVLERSEEGMANRKEVWTLNVANKEEHESWALKHDETLSSYRAFDEPDGFGEEGETVGIARFKANDHYIYLYAAQVDDTHNISLLASTTLEKFIPVAYLKRFTASDRYYTLMSVYKDNILCATRTNNKEVIVYIANGIVNRLEAIGQSDSKIFTASPIEFDAEDSEEVKAQKLNALVQTLVDNKLMRGWRDYTLKMAYACESQPSKPYDDFVKSATNQGVMYALKRTEGYFRIRITLPEQNIAQNATTVKFAVSRNSGALLQSLTAPIVSRENGFVVAEYVGSPFPYYGEALFVWFYDGVAQSAITTEGVKVEIFE